MESEMLVCAAHMRKLNYTPYERKDVYMELGKTYRVREQRNFCLWFFV